MRQKRVLLSVHLKVCQPTVGMSSHTHQDWTPIVISKPRERPEPKKKVAGPKPVAHDEDAPPPEKCTHQQKISLTQARQAAGYKTQKMLAAACNGRITESRLREIENGKGVALSGQEKQILHRILKTKL